MSRRRYDCEYGCSVEATLDVIGGRWKGVILFHLLGGKRRFGELRRLLPEVTQRMLTNQLRELETDGVVHRRIFMEVPPKVEYSLTDFGRSLEPVLVGMRDWGDQWLSTIKANKAGRAGAAVAQGTEDGDGNDDRDAEGEESRQ